MYHVGEDYRLQPLHLLLLFFRGGSRRVGGQLCTDHTVNLLWRREPVRLLDNEEDVGVWQSALLKLHSCQEGSDNAEDGPLHQLV